MTIIVYILSLVGLFLLPNVFAFLLFNAVRGMGNAGTKIIRSTMLMELIPTQLLGRVSSFYSSFGLLVRTLFLLVSTSIIEQAGAAALFGISAGIMLISLLIIQFTGKLQKLQLNS